MGRLLGWVTAGVAFGGMACAGKVQSADEEVGPDGGSDHDAVDNSDEDTEIDPPLDEDDEDYAPPTVANWRCPDVSLREACYSPSEWLERSMGEAGAGGELRCPEPEIMLPERPTYIDNCQTLPLELCEPGELVSFGSTDESDLWCCYQAVLQSTPCD